MRDKTFMYKEEETEKATYVEKCPVTKDKMTVKVTDKGNHYTTEAGGKFYVSSDD